MKQVSVDISKKECGELLVGIVSKKFTLKLVSALRGSNSVVPVPQSHLKRRYKKSKDKSEGIATQSILPQEKNILPQSPIKRKYRKRKTSTESNLPVQQRRQRRKKEVLQMDIADIIGN